MRKRRFEFSMLEDDVESGGFRHLEDQTHLGGIFTALQLGEKSYADSGDVGKLALRQSLLLAGLADQGADGFHIVDDDSTFFHG